MTTAVIDLAGAPPLNTLKSPDLWRALEGCEDPAVLGLWQNFGTMLLAEAQARTAALESKANSLLGWSGAAAVAGVSLDKIPTWMGAFCVAPAALAVICGFMALRVRETAVPSQLDWFNHAESCDATRLQRFYLLAMRDWHEKDADTNRAKGAWLTMGQNSLAISAVVLFLLLVMSVVGLPTFL